MDYHGTWIMTQTWDQLLFLHWKINPDEVIPLLPKDLELDTYEGNAWLTVLPFRVSQQRFHCLPEIPLLRKYLELNIRTYVTYKGKPGVYFFTLDANHPLAVLGAKTAGLPFRLAKMAYHQHDDVVVFKSRRRFGEGKLMVEYAPVGEPVPTAAGSLDCWLLERYSMFTKLGNLLLRGDIYHESWEVSGARARIRENSAAPFGLKGEPELIHYCLRKKAFIYLLKKA